jgi:gliding motility-associated-like protein
LHDTSKIIFHKPIMMVEKTVGLLLPLLVVCFICNTPLWSQPLQWNKKFGGSQVDIPLAMKATTGNGTIITGYTDSKNGDVEPHAERDYWDLWVVKLNQCGGMEWEQSFGGSNYEAGHDVVQTPDGGYLIAGETNSTDGGVVAGYGGTKDIWLLKLSAAGNLEWQKRYGGNGLDIANCIRPSSDGGYYIAASSSSNNGDITGNHGTGGYTDGVLLKINASGTLQWSKCFGGSRNEELLDIEIINGNIYLAGYANSIDGDIPPNQKNYDVWLLALDAGGNRIFSKIYGGSQNDVAYSMTKGADGTVTLAGYTTSNDGDVSGAKGSQDYWLLNINNRGSLNWQKTLGGSEADYANSIITDKDGGYIAGGISYSNDGDVDSARGNGDFWVVKTNAAGMVQWKRNLGGSNSDHLRQIIYNVTDDEYYLAGDSESGNGDATAPSKGETDFWILKLKEPRLINADSVVCSTVNFTAAPDTLQDVCGYDSIILQYKPVLINGPFAGIAKADSVFEGQSIVLPFTGNATAAWAPSATLSCSACRNPVAAPLITTVYTATNFLDSSCRVTDNYTVVVLKDAVVNIPSAFTPNGDGLNDLFGAAGKVPGEFSFNIYNRYGQIIFKSSTVQPHWDGTFRGKRMPAGAYVYEIRYRDIQKRMQQKKGVVMLLK